MFNNADTVAREQRLAVHIGNLAKLAEALDEFSELKTRMHSAVAFYADDPASEFDSDYSDRINQRLSVIERNLLVQLYEYFDRGSAYFPLSAVCGKKLQQRLFGALPQIIFFRDGKM